MTPQRSTHRSARSEWSSSRPPLRPCSQSFHVARATLSSTGATSSPPDRNGRRDGTPSSRIRPHGSRIASASAQQQSTHSMHRHQRAQWRSGNSPARLRPLSGQASESPSSTLRTRTQAVRSPARVTRCASRSSCGHRANCPTQPTPPHPSRRSSCWLAAQPSGLSTRSATPDRFCSVSPRSPTSLRSQHG